MSWGGAGGRIGLLLGELGVRAWKRNQDLFIRSGWDLCVNCPELDTSFGTFPNELLLILGRREAQYLMPAPIDLHPVLIFDFIHI